MLEVGQDTQTPPPPWVFAAVLRLPAFTSITGDVRIQFKSSEGKKVSFIFSLLSYMADSRCSRILDRREKKEEKGRGGEGEEGLNNLIWLEHCIQENSYESQLEIRVSYC